MVEVGRGHGAQRLTNEIGEVTGEAVDKRTIIVGNPIKSLGNHAVSVKLHDEVSAAVAPNVIPA